MPTRTTLNRATWGTTARPVRTNVDRPLPGATGVLGGLLTNGPPDGWVADQLLPVGWSGAIAADGSPPAWWQGYAIDDGWSPIGPHGPWLEQGTPAPIITRATSLIVDPLTAAPFQTVDPDDLGARFPTPRWLTDPQLLRPDDRFGAPLFTLPLLQRQPRSIFWRDYLACAVWFGRGWLWFAETSTNEPIAGTLRILHPRFVNREYGGFRVGDDQSPVWFDGDGRTTIGGIPQRIVELRNPHGPLGVFAANPDVFKLGRRMANYLDGAFGSGVPAGYLKVTNPAPITQDQADDLRARWMAAHGGDRRSIAVLNSSTEFHAIQLNPEQMMLSESKRLQIADVAYAFGMAPETLGITMGNSATYSNVEQWFDAHRDFALSPWIAALEGVTSALLPGRLETRVDLDAFTRPSWSQWAATAVQLVQAGVFTPDEIRAQRGYGPLPENAGADPNR